MARQSTLPPTWKALADKVGGVGKLADALGVAPNTLYRWARGESAISGPGSILLAQLCGGKPLKPEK